MPVLPYAYLDARGQTQPAAFNHEAHALIDIVKRLWTAFHDRDEVYAVVCNLHRDNRPAADLAIISEFGVGVMELKGHPGTIRAEGDAWYAGSQPIKGGVHGNPYRQVQTNALDVRQRLFLLKPHWQQIEVDRSDWVKVQTAVCFTHPDAQVRELRRRYSPPAGQRAVWERFSIVSPAEVAEWAASLRFELSEQLPQGEGFRALNLSWDEIGLFAAGYLDASPWTGIAHLMPPDEPYGLLILQDEQRRLVFTLDRDEVIVGRDARQCTLVLPDDYTLVSKRHAAIRRIGREVWLSDLGSTNGVYLDGQRVTESQLLRFGQRIRLGSRSHAPRACALLYQAPDFLSAGPTEFGSSVLGAG
jgi:hypothetical protein